MPEASGNTGSDHGDWREGRWLLTHLLTCVPPTWGFRTRHTLLGSLATAHHSTSDGQEGPGLGCLTCSWLGWRQALLGSATAVT